MSDIRFKGLARSNTSFGKLLNELTGWKAHRDGQDWVVPKNDPVLRTGPRDILTLHMPFRIKKDNGRKQATELIGSLVEKDDPYFRNPDSPLSYPERIEVHSNYGDRSELDEMLIRFYFCSPHNYESTLPIIFEYTESKLHSDTVVALEADYQYQQAIISLSKISLFTSRYGIEESERRIFKNRALGGAIPGVDSVLGFVEPFMCFSPSCIGIPFSKFSFTLYFYGNDPVNFPFPAISNYFDKFISSETTISQDSTPDFIQNFTLKRKNIGTMIAVVVKAINSVMRFANNYRNFTDKNGSIDFLSHLQFIGAVWYIFSDFELVAQNYSPDLRTKMTFAAFDKLANLKNRRNKSFNETEYWMAFFSQDQCKLVAKILRKLIHADSEYLFNVFNRTIRAHYKTLQKGFQPSQTGTSERDNLKNLRSFRNLHHGTYLQKNRFEDLFLEQRGVVAPEVAGILYLNLLAFCASPGEFLGHTPVINS